MPIWSEIGQEIVSAGMDFDSVRRKYLVEVHRKSGRSVILYASCFVQKDADAAFVSDEDLEALMEVSYKLGKGPGLDLILHSPGGSAEAAEAMVWYLRSRFSDIRVIVPQLAMSAATMIACAANRICLGKHSFLGPTDPQLTTIAGWPSPAQSILDQFERAQTECSEYPERLRVWEPMLHFYAPDLLAQCETSLQLSKELVETWLKKYMFSEESDRQEKAEAIANWLLDHRLFKSHSRHIPREQLREKGLKIENLEDDPDFQDLVLSVHHATTHTFAGTPAVKIVENHLGRTYFMT